MQKNVFVEALASDRWFLCDLLKKVFDKRHTSQLLASDRSPGCPEMTVINNASL